MTIDDVTGLPELPEGYFWRIANRVSIYIDVEIRKKTWIGSKMVTQKVTTISDASARRIRTLAELAHRDVFGDGASWRQILGDYPPKKLETSL